MSFSTRIRSLGASVKRLEAAAGMGAKGCASCRLHRRHAWPDPTKPPLPAEHVMFTRCEFCRTWYGLNLAGMSEDERAVERLRGSFTTEDYYTNPKAHALDVWLHYRKKIWGYHDAVVEKPRAPAPRPSREIVDVRGARALSKLRKEAAGLSARLRRRLQAKYGSDPFPEHTRIVKSVVNRERPDRGLGDSAGEPYDLAVNETRHLICAEFEKIVWGHIRPDTALALESIIRRFDELVGEKAERLNEAKRLEEEKRRRSLAAQEEERRRRAEAAEKEKRRKLEEEKEAERRAVDARRAARIRLGLPPEDPIYVRPAESREGEP